MDASGLGLTQREQQIIVRLARAKHLEHLDEKLGVSGRRQAAANLSGWLTTPSPTD